ncbi:MAG: hypothetical protein IJ496_08895 [Ruminococcus sp.]|nr:hypothetical protein [Ruminococcus sp.]
MKKKTVQITASTKLTMVFCGSTVVLAVLLFTFLVFFPIKMDNPKNGINQKLIASATTQPAITTTAPEEAVTETDTVFSNTRLTTDRNRGTVTVFTETIRPSQNSYNNSDYNDYNDTPQPVITQAPTVSTGPAVIETQLPSVETQPPVIETQPPVAETDPPAVETQAPAAPVVSDAPQEEQGSV